MMSHTAESLPYPLAFGNLTCTLYSGQRPRFHAILGGMRRAVRQRSPRFAPDAVRKELALDGIESPANALEHVNRLSEGRYWSGGAVALWLALPGGNILNPARLLAIALIVRRAFVHEFAHAAAVVRWATTRLWQGRYTLNPLAHIDPFGALLILLRRLRWAKPVQWNRQHQHGRAPGSIIVSLARPAQQPGDGDSRRADHRLAALQRIRAQLLAFFFWQINVLLLSLTDPHPAAGRFAYPVCAAAGGQLPAAHAVEPVRFSDPARCDLWRWASFACRPT